MKRFVLILGGIALLLSCEHVDPLRWGDSRNGKVGTGTIGRLRDTGSVSAPVPDTVVWVCAVRVPDSYDWARDTADGRFPAEVILYRNYSPVLILQAGEASACSHIPGTHHIRGGHLYSEFSSAGRMRIGRDGSPLLDFGEGGFLRDLLSHEDGSVYTLTCNPSEGSLTLRKDGQMVVRIGKGRSMGGFGDGSPALYFDEGSCCFCFSDGVSLFSVRDGSISAVIPPEPGGKAEDFRYKDGEAMLLWSGSDGRCHLRRSGKDRYLMNVSAGVHFVEKGGRFYADAGPVWGLWDQRRLVCLEDYSTLYLKGRDCWLGAAGGEPFAVQPRDPLSVSRPRPNPLGGDIIYSEEGAMVFTEECLASIGSEPLIGVSFPGGRPHMVRGSRVVAEFPFNGYITAVETQIIPPSL